VPYSFPLTDATATKLMQSDIKTFTKCISDYLKDSVKLNDNQYGGSPILFPPSLFLQVTDDGFFSARELGIQQWLRKRTYFVAN
jgi:hypothetical protein